MHQVAESHMQQQRSKVLMSSVTVQDLSSKLNDERPITCRVLDVRHTRFNSSIQTALIKLVGLRMVALSAQQKLH